MEGKRRKKREAIGRKDHVLYKEARKPGIREMFGFTAETKRGVAATKSEARWTMNHKQNPFALSLSKGE